MGKLAPTSIKYLIKASIKADGVVDKPDVIGAVFGQTEGLLGNDLNLRELQKTGRIGRIEVNIKSEKGTSTGEVIIPSSLDSAETALIAATLETIERVGPCTAEIKLAGVEDVREDKRKYVIDKAKEILEKMMKTGTTEADGISQEIKKSVRAGDVIEIKGMTAGPEVESSPEVILVEGRADVINLLGAGIKNTVAVGGTNVAKNVGELCKGKSVTAFVDGDRGGQLIVRALAQVTTLNFVAQAPEKKEVEELDQKDIFKALREKVTFEQFRDNDFKMPFKKPMEEGPADGPVVMERPAEGSFEGRGEFRGGDRRGGRDRGGRGFGRERGGRDRGGRGFGDRRERRENFGEESRSAPLPEEQKTMFKKTLKDLDGTKSACIFDASNNLMGKVPVADLDTTLGALDNPYIVVMDGHVSFGLAMAAKRSGVKFLVGNDAEEMRVPVKIVQKKDLA